MLYEMKNINVKLNIISRSLHTSQIITGFLLLRDREVINLEINKNYSNINNYPHEHLVEAVVNSDIKIAFDMLDGYNFDFELVEKYLDNIDILFKRSFSKKINSKIKGGGKIFPLGFNYHLTHPENPIDYSEKPLNFLKHIIKYFLQLSKRKDFTADIFECKPEYKENDFKIIFFTRLWEPNLSSDKLNEERILINKMRVKIIRELKAKYPKKFIGGITKSDYAKKYCKDLILSKKITDRKKYLSTMHDADICIGSMGLHKSIGWKTGEYIAASKAIINEKLKYEVIGDFKEGTNYISYDNLSECIRAVDYLVSNPDKTYKMRCANHRYYKKYLKPDKLIKNSLKKVVTKLN
jgi:hypothetical protein